MLNELPVVPEGQAYTDAESEHKKGASLVSEIALGYAAGWRIDYIEAGIYTHDNA